MKRLLTIALLAIFTFTLALPAIADEQQIRSQVRVHFNRDVNIGSLLAMGSLTACGYQVGPNYADIIILPEEVEALKSRGCQLEILEENIDDQLKEYREKGNLGVYRSVVQVEELLQSYQASHPEITKLESIGTSWEDRDIWALKISDNPEEDEEEPACLVMGAHHAREWISYEVPLALIERLLTGYGSDEIITNLVDEREIWIVPLVNPDGVNHSHESYKMWRKNRRPAPAALRRWGSKIGVDLNRNYSYAWGNTGASDYTGSDVYHGPNSFSEPESCAIRDLALRENFTTSTSFHSYSELVLYPFGYAYDVPNPHEPVFKEMAGEMAKLNGYEAINSADLYPAAGDSEDWLYGDAGVFSMLIELAWTFVPPDSQVPGICEGNVNACLYQIERAGDLVEERTRHIAEVQSYLNSILKPSATASRELTREEKQEYMRMIKLRNIHRNKLVEEILGDRNLDKAKSFTEILKELPANLQPVYIPAINEIIGAIKTLGLGRDDSEQLIGDLLEISGLSR